jgi:hypothetical protein
VDTHEAKVLARMTVYCPTCETPFEQRPNGRKKYCSRPCQVTAQKRPAQAPATYITWRRKLALSEALALRCLLRSHGRLPGFKPTVVTMADWHHHMRGMESQRRAVA